MAKAYFDSKSNGRLLKCSLAFFKKQWQNNKKERSEELKLLMILHGKKVHTKPNTPDFMPFGISVFFLRTLGELLLHPPPLPRKSLNKNCTEKDKLAFSAKHPAFKGSPSLFRVHVVIAEKQS